ncbi:MAG: ABC transporter permease, partial [Desulfofustis sp.]|nr:ABC transporter permease [Desulfofustis sp.]
MTRESLVCFYTIARRETTRIFRIWVQTLVPPVITMTLYFIVFGSFIGSQLSGIKGFEYM